jgi:putative serine protease PepD
MSDNQGERPADQNTDSSAPVAPESQPTTASAAPSAPAAPALPPVPPTVPAAQAAPAQPAAQPAAAQPAPQAPRQASPAGYPAAHAPQAPTYAPPYGYAGQQGAYPQAYAGQQQGAAFGVQPGAQQTIPVGAPATGAVTAKAPKKSSGAGKVVGLIVAAAIVGGAAGLGGAYAGVELFSPTGDSPAAGPTTVTVNDTGKVNNTTAIAAKVVPSVVTIEATGSSAAGTGSGVVLTADGYVVTNTHVVTLDGATGDAKIRVTTADGHVYDATVVGTDPTYDLAVIKLKGASGLTPVEFGDSSKLNVGDETVAIGAPLGLANTVTTGIVSALNRSIEIASSAAPDSSDSGDSGSQGDQGQQDPNSPFFFDFGDGSQTQSQTPSESIKIAVIQTDAAINPGNSGGALVDSDGKLIGINVAIASAGGSSGGQSGSIGVGFSIPSDIAKRVTDEIIADGKATHGLLGANVQSAADVEGTSITGAYIAEVVDGGAAQKAGLQKGDIVTSFNGVPITDSVDLTAQVRAAAAGSEAKVTYVRGDKTETLTVTLGELTQ